jgi:death-on-curing protein
MAKSPVATPRWVPRLVLDAAHLDQLREHGGLPSVRDENALEAALARPRQNHHYESDSDLAALAAAYAFGLAKAHPFNDGNKRAAFLAAMIFLGLNGKDLDATETEVVQVMTALAAGSLTEAALATWMRERIIRLKL